jgi:hypothetical protein
MNQFMHSFILFLFWDNLDSSEQKAKYHVIEPSYQQGSNPTQSISILASQLKGKTE